MDPASCAPSSVRDEDAVVEMFSVTLHRRDVSPAWGWWWSGGAHVPRLWLWAPSEQFRYELHYGTGLQSASWGVTPVRSARRTNRGITTNLRGVLGAVNLPARTCKSDTANEMVGCALGSRSLTSVEMAWKMFGSVAYERQRPMAVCASNRRWRVRSAISRRPVCSGLSREHGR